MSLKIRRQIQFLPHVPAFEYLRKTLLAVGLLAASTVNAGQNFNYSYFGASAVFSYQEVLNKELDGKGVVAGGSYELSSIPLNLKAGFSHNSIDKDEAGGTDISSNSYSVGIEYVLSVAEGFDILPGTQASYIHAEQKAVGQKKTQSYSVFAPGIQTRYRVKDGLILDGKVAHVMSSEKTVAIKHNTRNKTIYTGRVAGNCAQQAKNSCS